MTQLAEMLTGSGLTAHAVNKLVAIFTACRTKFPDQYEHLMPFGHGVFAGVTSEVPDLNRLWSERLVHLLRRPLIEPHPFTNEIETNYPWRDPAYQTPPPS